MAVLQQSGVHAKNDSCLIHRGRKSRIQKDAKMYPNDISSFPNLSPVPASLFLGEWEHKAEQLINSAFFLIPSNILYIVFLGAWCYF